MSIEQLYQLYLKYPQVQTDTRQLKKGDIFFALRGDNFNGNLFAAKALEAGAAAAVIDDPSCYIDERTILVTDVLHTLQQLAKYHREQFKIPFIAITGSNGKTTSKNSHPLAKNTISRRNSVVNNFNVPSRTPKFLL
jgi:UDP-N-acetylmuramoyl-tripeptide--D-alanyl-D-alanine ligase